MTEQERIRKLAEWLGVDSMGFVGKTAVHLTQWNPLLCIHDAWMLVEGAIKKCQYFTIYYVETNNEWCVMYPGGDVYADTAALAICEAVEKLMEVEG